MKNFFGKYGHQLKVIDSDDLSEKLSSINCTVPSKAKGRTSEAEERYCLKIYLLESDRMNLLTFPLEITKPARHTAPDFILKCGDGSTIGIEHTNAISENEQRANAISRRYPKGTFLDLSFFSRSQGKISREQLKGGIILPKEKLKSKGWIGDEMESQWAKFFKEAIFKKLKDLNKKGHYLSANRYDLLIYDNTPTIALDLGKALRILKNITVTELSKLQFSQRFDYISIVYEIYESRLLYNAVTIK